MLRLGVERAGQQAPDYQELTCGESKFHPAGMGIVGVQSRKARVTAEGVLSVGKPDTLDSKPEDMLCGWWRAEQPCTGRST